MSHLRFTATHEWLNTEIEDETMCVGITDHAQRLLGDMVYIELPAVGTEVHAGDEIGVLESVKAASEIYAPISGEILATNGAVTDNPALLNSDPFGAGWLVKIKPYEPVKAAEEVSHLLEEAAYLSDVADKD